MHRAAENLDRKFPAYSRRDLVLDCIAFMILCEKLSELDEVFELTVSILLSPDVSVADKGLEKLNTFHKAGFTDIMGNESNFDVELTFDDDGDKDGISINSPFFLLLQHFPKSREQHEIIR